MNCSVCHTFLKASDKVALASCGHLVHLFKNVCLDSDRCSVCEEAFTIDGSAPLVKLDLKLDTEIVSLEETPNPTPKDDEKNFNVIKNNIKNEKAEEEAEVGVEISTKRVERKLDDGFILKQFKVQRELTKLLMDKIKLTDDFVTIAKEQHEEFKKVSSLVVKLHNESDVMKNKMKDLEENINDLNLFFGGESDDRCSCGGEKRDKKS